MVCQEVLYDRGMMYTELLASKHDPKKFTAFFTNLK